MQKAVESDLADRDEIVDFIMKALSADNYIPDGRQELLRTALWREYQRFIGEDIRELYSEIETIVRGAPGEDRDRFVEMLISIFGEHEIQPIITFAPLDAQGPNPQLLLDNELIVKGKVSKRVFKRTVNRYLSDW